MPAFQKTRDGYWHVRLVLPDRTQLSRTTGSKRKPSVTVIRKMERELAREHAERIAAAVKAAKKRRTRAPADGDLLDRYLLAFAADHSPGDSDSTACRLNLAARALGRNPEAWGLNRVQDFWTAGLNGSAHGRQLRPWSKRNRNLYRQAMDAFLDWCVERGHLEVNPIAFPKTRPLKLPKRLPRWYTEEEVGERLAAARSWDELQVSHGREPWMEFAIRLFLGTGARLQGIAFLKWTKVDLRARKIRVVEKGDKERAIPLAAIAAEALEAVPKSERTGYVVKADRIRARGDGSLARAMKRAGLEYKGMWHTFRHTYASAMIKQGTPLKAVGELLGQDSWQATEIYAHLAEDFLEQEAGRLAYGVEE